MEQYSSLIILLLFFGVMYFVLIRPQQKRQQQHSKMVRELQLGDDIVTVGGVHGTVKALGDETVDIEVTDDVVIRVQRSSIGRVVQHELDAATETDTDTTAEQ